MPEDIPPPSHADLEAAYQSGNFAEVDRLTKRVLSDRRSDTDAKAAAHTLVERIAIDPLALCALGFAVLVFCAIVARYVL
jgi:hypothetical protein